MGLFSNRRTALERRRRKLDRELTTIQEDLRAAGGGSDRPDEPGEFGDGQRMDPESGEGVRDSRFARYFANSFERVRPLRQERRIQRNKAILMVAFVLVLLVWVVFRFLR